MSDTGRIVGGGAKAAVRASRIKFAERRRAAVAVQLLQQSERLLRRWPWSGPLLELALG